MFTKMNAFTLEEQRLKTPSSKSQVKSLQTNFKRMSREYPSVKLFVVSPRLILVQTEPEMIEYARKCWLLDLILNLLTQLDDV